MKYPVTFFPFIRLYGKSEEKTGLGLLSQIKEGERTCLEGTGV